MLLPDGLLRYVRGRCLNNKKIMLNQLETLSYVCKLTMRMDAHTVVHIHLYIPPYNQYNQNLYCNDKCYMESPVYMNTVSACAKLPKVQ